MKIIAYVDGASRGNPGPSGIGVVLTDETGKTLAEIRRYIGEGTNNRAEYAAVLLALEEAKARGADAVEVRSDSQLLVRQLSGEYRIKDKDLLKQARQVEALRASFSSCAFVHIPRQENKLADRLSVQAVNQGLLRRR